MWCISCGFIVVAALQQLSQLQAKLVAEDSDPKSSEMWSSPLYSSNNNTDSYFGNKISVIKEQDMTGKLQNINEAEHYNNNNSFQMLKVNQASNKETNSVGHNTAAAGGKVEQSIDNYHKYTHNNVSQTATTTTLLMRYAQPTAKADLSSATTTKAQRTGDEASFEQFGSTRFHRPSNYAVNPFDQLVAFFGNHSLQEYTRSLLFKAEQHTVFRLHTSVPVDTHMKMSSAGNGRVLHFVTDSLGAAFGGRKTAVEKVEEVQLYNATSLRQSRFNPFNPTRILIHGWFGGSRANVYSTLVPAYLRRGAGDYNVFTVDWGRGAVADYITASYRVKPVGKVLAKFIDFLHEESGMRYEDLHLIGFSMGAHIAGITGKYVQTGRLPVIYALDPAQPFFRYNHHNERVSIVDADYVEVIHTSVGSYGYARPLGHVDFYLNYGSQQPGCFFNECSHIRAFQVFAESLHVREAFRGQGCDVELWQDLIKHRRCLRRTFRTLTMGGDPLNVTALRRRGGIYYLETNASPPYAKTYEKLCREE